MHVFQVRVARSDRVNLQVLFDAQSSALLGHEQLKKKLLVSKLQCTGNSTVFPVISLGSRSSNGVHNRQHCKNYVIVLNLKQETFSILCTYPKIESGPSIKEPNGLLNLFLVQVVQIVGTISPS